MEEFGFQMPEVHIPPEFFDPLLRKRHEEWVKKYRQAKLDHPGEQVAYTATGEVYAKTHEELQMKLDELGISEQITYGFIPDPRVGYVSAATAA